MGQVANWFTSHTFDNVHLESVHILRGSAKDLILPESLIANAAHHITLVTVKVGFGDKR